MVSLHISSLTCSAVSGSFDHSGTGITRNILTGLESGGFRVCETGWYWKHVTVVVIRNVKDRSEVHGTTIRVQMRAVVGGT